MFKAIAYNKAEIIPLLLSYGADVDVVDDEGFTAYEFAQIRGNKQAIASIADYYRKDNGTVPTYHSIPKWESIEREYKENQSDVIQLSWYDSAGVADENKWIAAMMKALGYPSDVLPRTIYTSTDEEEYEEDFDEEAYEPPLISYHVVFDPRDSRYFFLIATYYDDFQYSYSFDFYVRCHPSEVSELKKIVQQMVYVDEGSQKKINIDHWDHTNPTPIQLEKRMEADGHIRNALEQLIAREEDR